MSVETSGLVVISNNDLLPTGFGIRSSRRKRGEEQRNGEAFGRELSVTEFSKYEFVSHYNRDFSCHWP
jgi:hypothetical protein